MEFCRICGILNTPLTVWSRDDETCCRKCKVGELCQFNRTPCGQVFCEKCGILIKNKSLNKRNTSDSNVCGQCDFLGVPCSTYETCQTSKCKSCRCYMCTYDYSFHSFGEHNAQTTRLVNNSEPELSKKTSTVFGQHRDTRPDSFYNSHFEVGLKDIKNIPDSLVENEILEKWKSEQLQLKKQLIMHDSQEVTQMLTIEGYTSCQEIFYIAGMDISFIKDNHVDACAALVIISYPELKLVYKQLEMVQLTAPYIPGFLAFREVDSLICLYNTMMSTAPQYKPHVIFVDGNGQLHPREFGLACHLGVLLDLPCVGVAKTLICFDGIEETAEHKARKETLKRAGDSFFLTTNSGQTLGAALRSTDSATNPVYISVGHKISLTSAVSLVQRCCKYRIPEPIRHADILSRQFLAEGR